MLAEQARAWLRRPVEVLQNGLHTVWTGYVQRVELQLGSQRLAFDLADVINRVRAEYDPRIPQVEWQGAKAVTGWVQDAASQTEFGVHEKWLQLGAMSEADALRATWEWLASHAQPALRVDPVRGETPAPHLKLICRGWWDTLHWQLSLPAPGMTGWVRPAPDPLTIAASSTEHSKLAQSFVVPGGSFHAAEVGFNLRTIGAPADSLRLELCASVNNLPGDVLATALLNPATLSASRWWAKFHFDPPVALAEGSTAWLVLARTSSADTVNACQCFADPSDPYSGGVLLSHNGSAWTYPNAGYYDLNFFVNGVQPRAELLAQTALMAQYVSGLKLEDPVDGFISLQRSGRETLRQLVERLIARNSAAVPRLNARVDEERRLVIGAWPDAGKNPAQVDAHGRLVRSNGRQFTPLDAATGAPGWYQIGGGWQDQVFPLERLVWQNGVMRPGQVV